MVLNICTRVQKVIGFITDGRGFIHFCGFEAWLLYNSFKRGVLIQNWVIETCPTPKAEK